MIAMKAQLDPWRVVCGVLFDCDDIDRIQSIIDEAGLIVDWNLTEKQDVSRRTRKKAWRPRVHAAYDRLADDNKLRVAFIVASEILAAWPLIREQLQDRLAKIGWGIESGRLAPIDQNVRELFFPERSQHDAYVQIRTLLQRVTKSLTIVDPYLDQSILTLLSTRAKDEVSVRLLTTKLPPDFLLEEQKWRLQYPTIALEVRTAKAFHDRFILLEGAEGTECWHIGCSIKDAGSKAFMLSQVEDDDNRAALINEIEKAWKSASVLAAPTDHRALPTKETRQ